MGTEDSDDDKQPYATMKCVAVIGYGPEAREHAMRLRAAGLSVSTGVRMGGMSWVRAQKDGFTPKPPKLAAAGADVVALLVPDDEQASVYWHIEPSVAAAALLVVGSALALRTGAFEPRTDAVLVTGNSALRGAGCRVAVHTDVTGGALERALAYARAAFGSSATIGTTTIDEAVDAEVAALEARAGGPAALLAEVTSASARERDSHAPNEARLAFCEGLQEIVERRARGVGPRPVHPSSSRVFIQGYRGHTRGAA